MDGIIQTFLLAMTPIGELRASIPVAVAVYGLNYTTAYFISVLGNLTPVVFLLLSFKPVSNWLIKNSRAFDKFFSWLFERTQKKVGERIKRYGPLALILFVAAPLPITGAWTGALVAFLFKIPFKKALPAILAGVMIAGLIVCLATYSGIVIEQYFGWLALLGLAVVITLGIIIPKKIWRI